MTIVYGTLRLSSKIRYGKNKKNAFKYKFIPFDSEKFETIIVSSKESSSVDVYASVNYEEKSLCEIIGKINDYARFEEYLMIRYNLRFPKKYYKNFEQNISKFIYDFDIRDYDTVSIDPPGAIDIDDAISVSETSIIVSIAVPSHFFKFKEMNENIESVYSLSKTHHLLPDEIVKKSSLFEKKERFALSISFEKNKEPKLMRTLIKNDREVTYESAEDDDIYKKIKTVYKNLFGDVMITPKDLVKDLMIRSNGFIASWEDKNLKTKIFRNFNDNTASYSEDMKIHEDLNRHYTHFTSPIRRLVDQVIHRNILNRLNNDDDDSQFSIDLEEVNEKKNKLNQFYSRLFILDMVRQEIKEIAVRVLGIKGKFLKCEYECKNLLVNLYPNILDEFVDIEIFEGRIHIKKFQESVHSINIGEILKLRVMCNVHDGIRGLNFEIIKD